MAGSSRSALRSILVILRSVLVSKFIQLEIYRTFVVLPGKPNSGSNAITWQSTVTTEPIGGTLHQIPQIIYQKIVESVPSRVLGGFKSEW
ncbi:hypothetical protein TNCV_2746261 [Trichonephila clavipes]|nr:hypothetical protein TNCV_2746261 [Trichonephila clavipes]